MKFYEAIIVDTCQKYPWCDSIVPACFKAFFESIDNLSKTFVLVDTEIYS